MKEHQALVIEDNENIALAWSDVLHDLKLKVKIAADIRSAEELIASQTSDSPFLLFTLDILLKGDYGLKLLRSHSEILTHANTIIITSWEDRFRQDVQRLGYRCVDKSSLVDKPYATLLDIVLALPSVRDAGIRSPWEKNA